MYKHIQTLSFLTIALGAATGAYAQGNSPGAAPAAGAVPSQASDMVGGKIVLDRCQVGLIHDVDIPAQVEGLLVDLQIDDGVRVSKGATIAVIDDRQAMLTLKLKRAEEAVAKLEAENDVNIRNAIATEGVKLAQAESTQQLFNQNAAKLTDLQEKKLEAQRATLSIELSKLQQQQAKGEAGAKSAERELAELEVARRQIICPFDGIIVEKFVQRGEWVQAGSKIARLVSHDKLRIEGTLDTSLFTAQAVMGAPVDVVVDITKNRQVTLRSKISFVRSEINPSSRSCPVRCEIDNQIEDGDYLIRPGMYAHMTIYPKTEVARQPIPR